MTKNLHAPSIETVVRSASLASGLEHDAITNGRDRECSRWRELAMAYLYSWRYTYAEIATHFKMNPASVHSAVARARKRIGAQEEDAVSGYGAIEGRVGESEKPLA